MRRVWSQCRYVPQFTPGVPGRSAGPATPLMAVTWAQRVYLADTVSAKQTPVQQLLALALDVKELIGSLDKPCGQHRTAKPECRGTNSIPGRQLSSRSSSAG